MGWCRKFGALEVDQGRDRFVRGGNTQALFGCCTDEVDEKGGPLQLETFQRQWHKATLRRGMGKETSWEGRGDQREGLPG